MYNIVAVKYVIKIMCFLFVHNKFESNLRFSVVNYLSILKKYIYICSYAYFKLNESIYVN